ncbi:MAG: hypothetical protein JOZ87_28440 [Chloroflexi bacterium]|nr:hypothetical protein [Chloroflexota bacterium]
MVALVLVFPLNAQNVDALPSQLPSHFAFGLGASPSDTWMPQSGIPWDYRMQYLAGGVNTGSGWETWNANGQFPLFYAQGSAQHGYIPVFPYYELLQSSGTCGSCGENQKDISNLNDSSLMAAYYANFALLMQRLGPGNYGGIQGFGKTAVVNIEPDFAGGYTVQATNNNAVCFGFCTGQGNDPSLLKASVASSGFGDVAAYPDTYAGYVQALAHLRDLYAPNVLIGLDVSQFATGDDIGLDSNPNTNVAALGQQVGAFVNRTGPHDLLFNNPLDRDAGQYRALFGQNRWWDRLNVSLPNFSRWEQYLKSIGAADGGRSILLWQVPLGNQYFDTENDTNNHYQDNRPEYIFSHVPELIQSGIVGAIFAAGNSGNTTNTDASGDGVTNPASFCTTDGVSSGQICNNHTSSVSDDDGGFVRMSGQAYYQHPVSLSGGGSQATSTPTPIPTISTPTPTASIPATFTTSAVAAPTSSAPGQTVTLTTLVTASQTASVLVDVEVYDPSSNKVFQQAFDNQSFAAGQQRTFTSSWQVASGAPTGSYTIDVGVFSPGWGALLAWHSAAASESVGASAPPATSTPTPLPTATNTPTRTPTPPPTNTPPPPTAATLSFATGATVSPATVARGSASTIAVSVKSATAATTLVDVEVYNASGVKSFQQWWDNQAFSAGQTRTFSASWSVPASATTGNYTVMVGVFSTGWGTLYNWNGNAAVLTID